MSKWQYPMTGKAKQAMKAARQYAAERGHGYIGTEHILIGLLQTGCSASDILNYYKVTAERVRELAESLISPDRPGGQREPELSPQGEKVLDEARSIALRMEEEVLSTDHLLLALLRVGDSAAVRLLNTLEADPKHLTNALAATMGPRGDVWRVENEENGAGGTPTLEAYSRDLTALAAAGAMDPVIGREKELQRLLRILSRRTKNNPCLMGEPGVGKTAIVEALAGRMAAGEVPENLQGMRLLALDLSGMVAGTKYRGEFEERIRKVVAETASAGNILLFLDEMHTLIGAGGAEGSLDAANILKPALSRGEIRLVGATTVDEYRKHIEKDPALERRFQPILVEEPSETETVEILLGLQSCYEKHHGVTITREAVEKAASLSSRYIHDRFLPDKALDLLDEAAAHVRMKNVAVPFGREETEKLLRELEQQKEEAVLQGEFHRIPEIRREQERLRARKIRSRRRTGVVTGEAVAEVVAEITRIPVKKLAEADNERLRSLEKVLHQRVVGQDEAASAVARAIRRGRMGLKNPGRPIGSFLFLGPTGVGKTELCKALAEAMFGRETAMIRVDMSEYMEKHSVSRMIGSPPGYVGYEEGGQLSEQVRRNPYSVILMDEIEKAHPDVFNILLQILDEGHVTDSQGRRIDFRNTVLIMTSNAGAERIMEPRRLGFSAAADAAADHERMKSGVMEEVRRTFRPEFLNRIDEVLVFHSLTKENMKDIFAILMKQVNRNVKEAQGLTLTLRPEARDWLVEKGYDPKYGARPLRRAIQTWLEDPLADALLEGTIAPGDRVRVSLKDGTLRFAPVKTAPKTERNHFREENCTTGGNPV